MVLPSSREEVAFDQMFLHPDASLRFKQELCSSDPGLPCALPFLPALPALPASCVPDMHLQLWRTLEAARVLPTHRNSTGGSSVATSFSQTRVGAQGEDDDLSQSLVSTWRRITIKTVRCMPKAHFFVT
eukprot:s2863_g18.t1